MGVAVTLAVGVVALVSGLAVLCFVRLVGIVLLGNARTEAADRAHESSPGMVGALAAVALVSVAVALAPRVLTDASLPVEVELLGSDWASPVRLAVHAPLGSLGTVNAVLWGLLFGGAALLRLVTLRRPVTSDATWGCGYAAPSTRMQYTSGSFAELVTTHVVPRALRSRHVEAAPAAKDLFPRPSTLSSTHVDPVTRRVYEPFLRRWADRLVRLRWLQKGQLHVYLVYILATTLAGLAWSALCASLSNGR